MRGVGRRVRACLRTGGRSSSGIVSRMLFIASSNSSKAAVVGALMPVLISASSFASMASASTASRWAPIVSKYASAPRPSGCASSRGPNSRSSALRVAKWSTREMTKSQMWNSYSATLLSSSGDSRSLPSRAEILPVAMKRERLGLPALSSPVVRRWNLPASVVLPL